jgi:wobble nucleotide-excising tRNase
MDIKKELQNGINDSRKVISKVEGEITAKQRIIVYKESETKKAEEGICPILKTSCDRIGKKMTASDKSKLFQEIEQLNHEIEQLKSSIEGDQDYLADLEMQLQEIDYKIEKARRKSLRLESAFQFKDYKYTKADIILYDESIKKWDDFAGWYIQNWLDSLTFIINDMLSKINLSISFSADKQFLTIIEEGRELDYSDLSSGQQIFLSVIFKLAILLQNNIIDGIVIIDEGINELKLNNVHKLIDILKSLPFQVFLIYQNIDEVEGIKQFIVVREKGISYVK